MKADSFRRAAPVNAHHRFLRLSLPVQAYPLFPLAVLCMLLSGCQSDTRAPAPTAVQPTATPQGVFPAFSDWRIAYVTQDDRLRIITLDGKTDLSGPMLSSPVLTESQESLWGQAVIAPDGRAIAYPGGVINLRPGAPGVEGIQPVDGQEFSWSPDSTRVVFYTHDARANYYWEVLDLTTTTSTILMDGSSPAKEEVIGWIDTTHLAVYMYTNDQSSLILSALDSTTGALRKIATISTDSLGYPSFSLSPDGSEILLTNFIGEGTTSFVPVAELITTNTGQKRHLPTILNVTGGAFLGIIIWKPGTQLALTSSGSLSYLLDLAHDTATPFAPGVVPLGWAPDTGTLYVSTAPAGAPNAALRYQVSAMAAPPPATAMQPVFSIESALFPFIGFARSA